MEQWAKAGEFNANFICICVNGDSTSLPVAREFGEQFKMTASVHGYIARKSDLPSFGQLGCQGLIIVDSNGNFISKESAKFMQQGDRAFRKVEKRLFQLGIYEGDRSQADFEPPAMRFPVGMKVECRVGRSQWAIGNVVDHRIFAMGREMPYKVVLRDGRMIFAPIDADHVIRKFIPEPTMELPSVGYGKIDNEHKECLDFLQQLRTNPCEEGLRAAHDFLKAHFDHEEALFAKSGFGNHGTELSGTKSHCEDHAAILSKIASFFGNEITPRAVADIMNHVTDHTRHFDTKYAGQLEAAI